MYVLLSIIKDFKIFCNESHGRFLKEVFSDMSDYSFLLKKRKSTQNLYKLAQGEDKIRNLIIDFALLSVCKNMRSNLHKIFHEMINLIYLSTDDSFWAKMHLILNDEKKIVFFCDKTKKFT